MSPTTAQSGQVPGRKPRVDRDAEILDELQRNARITNKDLARVVGVAPSTCLDRVRQMESHGVILGYRAEISSRALGVEVEAIVSARLARATEEAVATFRRHASELEAVVMILGLAGEVDFLLHIASRDAAHLQKILHQLAAFAEGVQLRTSVLVDVERYPFPHYAVNRSAS